MNAENEERFRRAGVAALGGLLGGLLGGPLGAGLLAAGALWVADELAKEHGDPQQPLPKDSYLVLVVRFSDHAELANLPLGKVLDENSCIDLFRISRFIWKGDKRQFESSIFPLFEQESSDSNNEYDVFLIALKVDSTISGLNEGDNPMDRRDAFLQMSGKSKVVAVSKPLTPDVYSEKGFYKSV